MYKPRESDWKVESSSNYEKVTDYIQLKITKLEKIQKDLKTIQKLYKDYISVTKDYHKKITKIVLELKPDSNTNEGELIQAIQGILLFPLFLSLLLFLLFVY